MATSLALDRPFWQRLRSLPWGIVGLLCLIALIGVAMLYSAGNGHFQPWADKHALRFVGGSVVMVGLALLSWRMWFLHAYPLYALALALLLVVEVCGLIGMGAQRWIDLYAFQIQPSEIMKIALILALARYFHMLPYDRIHKPTALLPAIGLILAPVLLVLRQPDLGTAMILLLVGGVLIFIAGVHLFYFVGAVGGGVLAVPVLWHFLHQYQKDRIINFLNPEHDPLNTGYQIMQSKIAFGSGGLWGRGFLQGSQSHLNFLPAKQTDFIFTMLCEEFGMAGGVGLVLLYTLLIAMTYTLAHAVRHVFGKLVVLGITTTLALYALINITMVMGLVPVVGIPLPLITYGGTSMLTLLFGYGIAMSIVAGRVMHDDSSRSIALFFTGGTR